MATGAPGKPRPLVQRPSQMFMAYTNQEDYEEFQLEKQVMSATQLTSKCFRGFEDCKAFLEDDSKRHEDQFGLLHMLLSDKIVDVFTAFESTEERVVLGNKLARLRIVEGLVDYYDFVMTQLNLRALTDDIVAKRREEAGIRLLLTIRRLLWDYSDSCPNFTEHIADSGMFRKLMVDIHYIYEDGLKNLEALIERKNVDVFVFCSALSILYNCARNQYIEKERFRECGIVDKLEPFLRSQHEYIRMLVLSSLVHMVAEDEMTRLDTDKHVVDFIQSAINDAIQSKDRRQFGFSVSELLDTLAALTASDHYKRLVATNHTLYLVMKVLRAQRVDELTSLIRLIWELAFIPEGRQKMKFHEELPEKYEDILMHHDNYELQHASRKAWFLIAHREERLEEGARDPPSTKTTGGEYGRPHILFSYHWGDRRAVMELYRVLRAEGYPLWIDVAESNKYTDVVECMTTAVEGASLVLVCISEKYKNSRHHRTELEYSFSLKKPMVALRVQSDYVADGWLAAVLGDTPVTAEFTQITPSTGQLRKLRENLRNHPIGCPSPSFLSQTSSRASGARGVSRGPSRISSRASVMGPAALQSARKVLLWTQEDIEHWASDFKLEGRAYRTVSKMTSEQILFVFQKWSRSPEQFYSWAETTMRLGSIEDLMRFKNAVKALTTYVT